MFNQSFNETFPGGSARETILDECKLCFGNNIDSICSMSGGRYVWWGDFTGPTVPKPLVCTVIHLWFVVAFSASLLLTSEHMLCFCHSVWG